MSKGETITKVYEIARERYQEYGVDTEKAIDQLSDIPISLHCWQGDDVGGFENKGSLSDGGIMATGDYPGKANTPDELRCDLDMALSLIPGTHRVNLHAIYADTDEFVERDRLEPKHFAGWVDWAKENNLGLDFNSTFFAHPKAADGFTLSHIDKGIRKFWIDHGIACRKIGEHFGKELNKPCVTNVWIPDGYKDIPVDRKAPRERLRESLDEMFAEKIDKRFLLDAVESKLFGIGSESCVIGSHEFYMGYAIRNNTLLCLDAGHFHPTEVISDKISSALTFLDEILLHVSRPVRWDSDHVVLLTDELYAIAQEVVRNGYVQRVHFGLDFFDASINRIAAWAIGSRSLCKALLAALLEPTEKLKAAEVQGDFTTRLALLEEAKTLPVGAVWDYYCEKANVPVESQWLGKVREYEAKVTNKR